MGYSESPSGEKKSRMPRPPKGCKGKAGIPTGVRDSLMGWGERRIQIATLCIANGDPGSRVGTGGRRAGRRDYCIAAYGNRINSSQGVVPEQSK